jgi:hypothetical protein
MVAAVRWISASAASNAAWLQISVFVGELMIWNTSLAHGAPQWQIGHHCAVENRPRTESKAPISDPMA